MYAGVQPGGVEADRAEPAIGIGADGRTERTDEGSWDGNDSEAPVKGLRGTESVRCGAEKR